MLAHDLELARGEVTRLEAEIRRCPHDWEEAYRVPETRFVKTISSDPAYQPPRHVWRVTSRCTRCGTTRKTEIDRHG